MRSAIVRYLSEAGVAERGIPIKFAASDAVYRLRPGVRTRTGTVTVTDYKPLAGGVAAEAMTQVNVDTTSPYSDEAMAELLDDDDFRNRLFETLVARVDEHRQKGTVRTNVVTLAKIPTGRPARISAETAAPLQPT